MSNNMTNLELFYQFRNLHPNFQLADWRPLVEEWIPKTIPAIMIWGKDGDFMVWFPKSKDDNT